jgi:serine/threonine-protein kinase
MFGDYLLLERIGRGGMAEIYLAQAPNELGASRRVVVKQMLPEHSADPLFMRALITEAKLAAGLSHHNIVRVLDLGREAERLYITMEYVEGFDLNQLLGKLSRNHIPLPLEFALFIAREVLVALSYAHRAVDAQGTPLGVVHRDVSPANVLISLEGEIRLCDFGIARAFAPEPALSDDSRADDAAHALFAALAGKAWYMSPEHARGQDVDSRSDLFAAGVLLWELCAGRRMYKSSDSSWFDPARITAIPELPDRGFPDAPRLQAVLRQALAVDPATRYQSAQEMLAELENYALSTGLMASELRFGAFLSQHFGAVFAKQRRARELAAEVALEGWTTLEASPRIGLVGVGAPSPFASHEYVSSRNGTLSVKLSEVEQNMRARGLVAAEQLKARRERPKRPGRLRAVALASGSAVMVLTALAYWLATH